MTTAPSSYETAKKFARLFKKGRGRTTDEISHIVKYVPAEKTNEIVLSEKEVARGEKTKSKQVKPKKAKHNVMKVIDEESQTWQVFADLEEEERNRETAEDDSTGPERTRRTPKESDRNRLPVYI